MSERSTTHATFVIERTFDAPPAQVFIAWAEPKAKARWFVGPDAWEKSDHKLDFRVGGQESVSGGPPGGPVHAYNATYWTRSCGARLRGLDKSERCEPHRDRHECQLFRAWLARHRPLMGRGAPAPVQWRSFAVLLS